MPRYPFTPELLDAFPEELAELYRNLEDTLLNEICSRLNLTDQLNEVTVQDIRALRSHGISLKDIENAIQKTTNIGQDDLNKLFDDVVERNQKYYSRMVDLAGVTAPQTLVSDSDVDAIRRQTLDTFKNLTSSMAFLVDNGRTMLAPASAYQWALDNAVLQVQSGAINYNQAIRSAVKQLADSGIKVATYESGHRDQIDVAVRRAVMTGVSQLCDKYSDQSAEYLGTRYFEISAHIGARDKPGKNPWSPHILWQGKVYYLSNIGERDPLEKYPDMVQSTGYGYVDGLSGANCRHKKYPWIEGVSERTYTDDQLKHIDDGHNVTFEGKHYTAYEATQKQRQIERTIRKLKREQTAYKAAGLVEDEQAVAVRIRRLNAEYKAFSEAAGLPMQRERINVYEGIKTTKSINIAASTKSVIIRDKEVNSGGGYVQPVGKIDINKYRVVSDQIRTDEVIITSERIQHIKDHHPNDYERYSAYIEEMVRNPQYILEDPAPNTAVILQEFTKKNEHFRLILKLAVTEDGANKKNSVITFLKISEKKFKKYLRNKKILYRSE